MTDDREAAPESAPAAAGTSRRSFLKAGGIAAAGAVVGGVAGAAIGASIAGGDSVRPDAEHVNPLQNEGFDHVVVLMGENRSFDNLLGRLYDPSSLPKGASFDGLAFGDYENKAPDGTRIPAHVYSGATDEVMSSPDPDPGEEYPHVNTQLFGTILPAANHGRGVPEMEAPYNLPRDDRTPTMDGFVLDYASHVTAMRHGKAPETVELERVMGGFAPGMLPVLSTLARSFAVYDSWHCAVPSQTFCNRSFFHASTSHGFVTNKDGGAYDKWLNAPASPTIFNRLEDAGIDWRIYYDELQLVSMTGVLHAPALEKYWQTSHFATMDQFYADVRDGTLPAYAFIEPRLIYDHNDFHPPVGTLRGSDVDGVEILDSAISDVRAGELLVHSVYDAIRTSPATTGSTSLNTLLLITFDEHGGTYDHVAPPVGEAPDEDAPPGEMGFRFDRLGCRVPAIAISAWTQSGSIIHDAMHHGSLIATLARRHGLEPLTRRDANAPTLLNAVTARTPRPASDWPVTTPQYFPANPEADLPHPAEADALRPLSPPAKGLLGLLLAKYGNPDEIDPQTYGDAYAVLKRYGAGLFGTRR